MRCLTGNSNLNCAMIEVHTDVLPAGTLQACADLMDFVRGDRPPAKEQMCRIPEAVPPATPIMVVLADCPILEARKVAVGPDRKSVV